MQIKTDPDFKNLIPPLTGEEYKQLEDNILANGCRDAIVLWKGVIIDGYNRFEICENHGIKYETVNMRLPSREAVKFWILENQLGRRNLTDAMRIELAIRKVGLLKQGTYVRKAVAQDAGVSEGKVHNYMQIKAKGDAGLIEKVMAGEVKIGTAFKQLEVYQTTVKTVYNEDEDYGEDIEKVKPDYAKAVLENLWLIGNLYRFFNEHGLRGMYFEGKGGQPEDGGELMGKLASQYKRVKRLVKNVKKIAGVSNGKTNRSTA